MAAFTLALTQLFPPLALPSHAALMKASPTLMMPAVVIYNNLIQKAKWANFGHTVEQDGDSHTLIFEEAGDAVKFCLQVIVLPLAITDSPQP